MTCGLLHRSVNRPSLSNGRIFVRSLLCSFDLFMVMSFVFSILGMVWVVYKLRIKCFFTIIFFSFLDLGFEIDYHTSKTLDHEVLLMVESLEDFQELLSLGRPCCGCNFPPNCSICNSSATCVNFLIKTMRFIIITEFLEVLSLQNYHRRIKRFSCISGWMDMILLMVSLNFHLVIRLKRTFGNSQDMSLEMLNPVWPST